MDRIKSLNSGFIMMFSNLENFNFKFKGHDFELDEFDQYFSFTCIPNNDKIDIYHRHSKYLNGYKYYTFTLNDLFPEDISSLLNLLIEKGYLLE